MATIMPKGESLRNAVKWISSKRLDGENKELSALIQAASLKFNLSPKEEAFLTSFFREN